jgi:hypothetical protein
MNNYWSDVKENLYTRQYGLPPVQQMTYEFTENNMAKARAQLRRNTYARSKNSYFGQAQRPLEGMPMARTPSPVPVVSYNSNNSFSSMSTPKKEMTPVEAKRALLRAERRKTNSPNRAARIKAIRNEATAKIQQWKGGRRALAATRRRVTRRQSRK